MVNNLQKTTCNKTGFLKMLMLGRKILRPDKVAAKIKNVITYFFTIYEQKIFKISNLSLFEYTNIVLVG